MRLPAIIFCGVIAGTAAAETPRVVTDIPPVQSLVSQVMGDLGTPSLLLDPAADPHHMTLRPSQMRALGSADAVFWIGPVLTPWLQKPLENLPQNARAVALTQVAGTHLIAAAESHGDHDDPQPAEIDPHAWLDPENGAIWLRAIAETLATLDPENAPVYRANAARGAARITTTAGKIKKQLAPFADARFLVIHDAFSYFGQSFGVDLSEAISGWDAASPSAGHLARLRAEMARFRCAFREPQQSTAALETLLAGTDVPLTVLDPLGLDVTPGAGLYVALLAQMGEAIATCSPRPAP